MIETKRPNARTYNGPEVSGVYVAAKIALTKNVIVLLVKEKSNGTWNGRVLIVRKNKVPVQTLSYDTNAKTLSGAVCAVWERVLPHILQDMSATMSKGLRDQSHAGAFRMAIYAMDKYL